MTVINLLKASFAICFAACLFVTGSCLVMEARVDCDRTVRRTLNHPGPCHILMIYLQLVRLNRKQTVAITSNRIRLY
jgi:hypothetical protein